MLLVLVAGPSGAGKDSLLNAARLAFAGDRRIRFARRVITRPADPGGEDHEPVSDSEFAARVFALSWKAHGLSYGIPDAALTGAAVVVANVSRGAIADAATRFPVRVIAVTAQAGVLAARLAARGREGAADVASRLDRRVTLPDGVEVETVCNDGTLAEAEARFIAALRRAIDAAPPPRNMKPVRAKEPTMLPQAIDFQAEANDLHALLVTLSGEDWDRPTLFKRWTVNDIVQHLHEGDLMAAASVAGADPFSRLRAEMQAARDSGLTRVQATRQRMGGLTGARLRETWFAQMTDLCAKLSGMAPDTRLKWAGPDMGVRMFATARQMETWAHGQAIYDLMGAVRAPTDRLRNIAEIGVRTYGWTFANRQRPVPGPAPYVRLTGPSGVNWEWNDPSPDNRVEGPALDFCQVVTQTRNIADTALRVAGDPAQNWMSLAQCFAGPPEEPPAAGSRFAALQATI